MSQPIMVQICGACARVNPAGASFCYYDGHALPGGAARGGDAGGSGFTNPLVMPSGQVCRSFDELALACQAQWDEARELLQQGFLETFFGGMGRADLARVAREAARFPDPDRGFDQLLARLPTAALRPPRLRVEPTTIALGALRVGEDRHFEVRLCNEGMRLLFGTVSCADTPWLSLGAGAGTQDRVFDLRTEQVIAVGVRGKLLRAGPKPLEGSIVIESNGGTATVTVSATVPITPFREGVLAGAQSPRQLAEKAKAAPREAAALLEQGAVARWYRDNGWTYPVRGPHAAGLGAVQQLFEALGLVKPPQVTISELTVTLRGSPGDRLGHVLDVSSPEPRPVYAHGMSDQPWLEVGRARSDGRRVSVPLAVPAVPDRCGQTLVAQVTVTANGQQRFVVPVTLAIGSPAGQGRRAEPSPTPTLAATPATAASSPGPAPVAGLREARGGWRKGMVLLPAVALTLAVLGVVGRDVYMRPAAPPDGEEIDHSPRIAIQLHEGKKGDFLDAVVPDPSMRFGLSMTKARDEQGRPKRLLADPWGRTNNTCLRLDGEERLFGSPPGEWVARSIPDWKDEHGQAHDGVQSVYRWPDKKVQVTQWVERVAGDQSDVTDTCLVRYEVRNQDGGPHAVGLRILLDTFIGANDGAPFTIPGETGLCDDKREFPSPDKVPAFIQALENQDLARPGTVARLKLRLGEGREPPSRVTLGAWPDEDLQRVLQVGGAKGAGTRWAVPVLSMKTLWPYDSAVAIYWDEAPLAAGARREVGFAYGLGTVSSSAKLLLSVDGSFKPGGQLTLTAVVNEPAPGETLTLVPPPGFEVQGDAMQKVPEPAAGSAWARAVVTWKVRAGEVGQYQLVVQSSAGARQGHALTIKTRSIFD